MARSRAHVIQDSGLGLFHYFGVVSGIPGLEYDLTRLVGHLTITTVVPPVEHIAERLVAWFPEERDTASQFPKR